MKSEIPSADLEAPFKQRAEELAVSSNEKLRTVVYRLLLSESKNEHNESNWMLLVAGGTLALILPNAKDLLEVYDIANFKIATGLLLASGTLGLFAKKIFGGLEKAIEGNDSHSKNISDALIDYAEQISTLKKEASEKGVAVEIPASSFKGLFEPLEKMNLSGVKSHIASELDLREKDPHRKWQGPINHQKRHSSLVFWQMLLLVTAFAIMLITLHPAK